MRIKSYFKNYFKKFCDVMSLLGPAAASPEALGGGDGGSGPQVEGKTGK